MNAASQISKNIMILIPANIDIEKVPELFNQFFKMN